jgi:hypothetical protein
VGQTDVFFSPLLDFDGVFPQKEGYLVERGVTHEKADNFG